jgi:hypothetical protein
MRVIFTLSDFDKLRVELLYYYIITNIFAFFSGFVCDFMDYVCVLTVEITEHTVASYEII